MEIWFDGSADGSRAAWAALVFEDGSKPRLLYGTARDVKAGTADRWAARRVPHRLRDTIAAAAGVVVVVFDRRDDISLPVNRDPRPHWTWRSHRHPLIHRFGRLANRLRRGLPLPATA